MNVLRFSALFSSVIFATIVGLICLPLVTFAQTDTLEAETADSVDNTVITTNEEPVLIPNIHSSTFKYQSLWYNTTDGTFTWDVPDGVTAAAVEVASSSSFEPMEVFKPAIGSYTLDDSVLEEGSQYFAVQLKGEDGWGDIAYHQILIDKTPPEPFQIESSKDDDVSVISFSTTDKLSGIERYEVLVGDVNTLHVTPMEAQSGIQLRNLPEGVYTVLVKAYDRAGNTTLSAKTLSLSPNASPGKQEDIVWNESLNGLVAILLVIALAQLCYILYLQRQSVQREVLLRKEAHEVACQMRKIFSALRDEIYDQINSLNKRPRLSKKEKEVVSGLNKALEVSEKLIEKEVDDVTDVLK